jgi:hypothetical protein
MKRYAILSTAVLIFGTLAVGQDDDRSARRNRDDERRERRRNDQMESTVETGFLFVDGQYVESPYRFQDVDSLNLSINGTPYELAAFDRRIDDRSRRNRSGGNSGRRVIRYLTEVLDNDGVIVLFSDQPVVVLDGNSSHELLKALIDDVARSAFSGGGHEWMPADVDHQKLNDWINGFRCPAVLRERATATIERNDRIMAEHHAKVAADRTLEASAYPLTIIGMLLVVVSAGHLLSFTANADGETDDPPNPKVQKAVLRALVLLTAMSILDVIWTILVSRTGGMKELNPLGAALIEDPQSLVILKATATSVAVGILFVIRRHPIAQRGAWWGCLICTLLTVRWLTFNSMFIG